MQDTERGELADVKVLGGLVSTHSIRCRILKGYYIIHRRRNQLSFNPFDRGLDRPFGLLR